MKVDLQPIQGSLLPPYEPGVGYGMFGYRGAMCERAMRADNVAMFAECLDREFIDHTSEMLAGGTVLDHCSRIAPKCAEMWKARLAA